MQIQLDSLLTELVDERISRFVWLRHFEAGKNSSGASRLLDRLEFLQALGIPNEILDDVPPHRIARLRRQGERYFADGLRDISSDRRLAILAVCSVEWQAAIADAVVETHDRIVGKTWRDAKRLSDTRVDDAKAAVQQTLRSFTDPGTALLAAHSDDVSLETAVSDTPGWAALEELVATSAQLTNTMAADPLAHVVQRYRRFRRYAPRMLKALDIKAAPVAGALVDAAGFIGSRDNSTERATGFMRKNSKWHRHHKSQTEGDHRLWEVAVLFYLRDTFRSGDICLGHSKRYADLKQALVPISAVLAIPRLT